MSLHGSVRSAPSGAKGFDSDTVLSLQVAQQFANQRYDFCIRYLSLGAGQAPGDLSTQEANNILSTGLALMPVQHVRASGWQPNTALGQEDGSHAVMNTQAIGFPAKVNVWCDLEGVSGAATVDDVANYCNAWYSAVSSAGYLPGLYVGSEAGLTSQQLYDLSFQHYWQSCSTVPVVAVRGYQMVQTFVADPVNGIGIDDDLTQTDSEGGQAQWLIRKRS
ncbi:DUF1906 domain-containing protein [Pseudomonas sp. NPDC086251]|uniref:DUF1906 domain-containing protein n=1 Tax=Pseudomonas sp. NPDC086251 TaxID=3364431 RepID=UPI0038391F10